jgi:hypothetical protein
VIVIPEACDLGSVQIMSVYIASPSITVIAPASIIAPFRIGCPRAAMIAIATSATMMATVPLITSLWVPITYATRRYS